MARNTLAVEYATPGTPAGDVQVYRLDNGSFIAIGNPFTPANGLITDNDAISHDRLAVEFAGNLYCVVGGDVRVFNPATQNWDAETLPAFTLDAVYDHTGFYVGRSSAGIPRLLWAARNNVNNVQGMYLEPGGSWTLTSEGPTLAQSANEGPSCGGMVYRNNLHFKSGANIAIYDFGADSWTVQTSLANTSRRAFFVRARGRAFMFTPSNDGNDQYLDVYEFTGGSYTSIADGSVANPDTLLQNSPTGWPFDTTANDAGSCWPAIYDAALDLIILFAYQDRGGGDRGFRVITVDPDTAAFNDVSNPVSPAAIRYPSGPDAGLDARIRVQVDNETDPLNPTVTVWLMYDDGQYEGFTYVDTSTTMVSIGAGGGREIALAHTVVGGGETFYEGSTTADPHRSVLEVAPRVPIPGGTRMFFTAWLFDETGGPPSVTDLTLGLYYNVTTQGGKGKPGALAQLTATALSSGGGSAPALNAGKVDNVTPDGASVYSVDWNAVGGGQVADGQFHQLMPRVEV